MVIEHTISTKLLRRAYDVWSHCYDWVAPLEHGPRLEALAMAGLQPGERVADIGCGPGRVAKRMREMVGPEGFVVGIDLSHQMLRRGSGCRLEADTRQLPVANGSFDVVFSAYVLDLLPLADIPATLREIHRILRPGGRAVLLNMTKRDPSRWQLMERVYQSLPRFVVAYLLGACRPVYLLGMTKDAGFQNVERRLLRGPMPSEVVTALR
ncbi:MAG: class I SAM-dependent methyltransferase [Bryobacterales bacterium]|nr:class I SAM-dependent methyltransferase [Bryobacterales bacterium]